MRILFFGTPEFAVPPLEAVQGAGHRVVLVVTRPDARRGRGRRPSPPPVKKAALRMGLELCQPRSLAGASCLERLRAADAELGVVVAYGAMLGREVLSVPQQGFLNLHASLLPKYRGAAPINWALIRGEEESGVTVLRMTPELDAGPILAQRRLAIGENETAGDLHDRLSAAGSALLVEVLNRLSTGQQVPERSQDPEGVSCAPKLTKKDGRIDWRRPAGELRNRVRGLTPWPGATTRFVGAERTEEVILLDVAAEPQADAGAQPGTVLGAGDEQGIVVQSGRGAVIIERLKPASGRAMSSADFLHGRRVRPGDRFE